MPRTRAPSVAFVMLFWTLAIAATSEADRLNEGVLRSLPGYSGAPVGSGSGERRPVPVVPKPGEAPVSRGMGPGGAERGLLPPRPFERCASPPCSRF